jgi:hypothetical protein
MTVHVYSTLACPQKFVTYKPGGADLPVVDKECLIKGGAGIASKNLITPHGVHTEIDDSDYAWLKDHVHFKQFVERGNIRVDEKLWDIDKIVGDMNPRDPGGPITPADYATGKQDGSAPIPVDGEKAGSGWVLSTR